MRKTLLGFIVILLIAGCGTKWKKTASVELQFVPRLEDGRNSFLRFNSGSIEIAQIEFIGDRTQARDVGFVDELENAISVDLSSGAQQESLGYDIQQGTFKEIQLDIRIENAAVDLPSLTLLGEFVDPQGIKTPVLFELDKRLDISLVAAEDVAGEKINFVESESSTMKVEFMVADWFGLVTVADLEHADQMDVDGEEVIVVSRSSNEHIFDLVLERIGEADRLLLD